MTVQNIILNVSFSTTVKNRPGVHRKGSGSDGMTNEALKNLISGALKFIVTVVDGAIVVDPFPYNLK